jgi:hypothetical protein
MLNIAIKCAFLDEGDYPFILLNLFCAPGVQWNVIMMNGFMAFVGLSLNGRNTSMGLPLDPGKGRGANPGQISVAMAGGCLFAASFHERIIK